MYFMYFKDKWSLNIYFLKTKLVSTIRFPIAIVLDIVFGKNQKYTS